MLRAVAALLLLCAAAQEPSVRFEAYDVYIDPGDRALAAWQFEVASGGGKIVGVESGEGPFAEEAPYYDPAALQGGRIVVAAFTTEEKIPAGRIRVARLHMQETGRAEYASKVTAAAAAGGARIEAKVEWVRRGGVK